LHDVRAASHTPPTVRRLLPVLVGIVIVVGGGLALLQLFNSRDSGEVGTGATPQGPGAFEAEPGDPPTSGDPGVARLQTEGEVPDDSLVAALAAGNVALVYGSAQPPRALERLRDETSGPFDPELAAGGLSVFLVRRPGIEGVQALAWQRRLEVQDASDPQLGEFVDAWLGQGREAAAG
jgi:hypothetical protein